ncbi:salivary glue protein Sgs-3-like isoform X2 [Eleutherodactylus coqui]|uniref:salivary glue protein Sgs-3-like isoform X2 n=1 Tax=Eleutherodactylus coqui TaxID=57060 RepID=UPI0034630812
MATGLIVFGAATTTPPTTTTTRQTTPTTTPPTTTTTRRTTQGAPCPCTEECPQSLQFLGLCSILGSRSCPCPPSTTPPTTTSTRRTTPTTTSPTRRTTQGAPCLCTEECPQSLMFLNLCSILGSRPCPCPLSRLS